MKANSQHGLDLVAQQAQIALELQEESVVLVGKHVPVQPVDVHNPVNELPLLCGVQNVAEELAGSGSLVSQLFTVFVKLERVVQHWKGRHLVRRHPILDAATVEELQVELLRCSPVGPARRPALPRNSSEMPISQPEPQEHAPRTTSVLKSCDCQAGAAADQGGIEPETAGLRKQARKPRDNVSRARKSHGATARAHDLRRGFIGLKTDARGAAARAI